jgi:hypothetical protein
MHPMSPFTGSLPAPSSVRTADWTGTGSTEALTKCSGKRGTLPEVGGQGDGL